MRNGFRFGVGLFSFFSISVLVSSIGWTAVSAERQPGEVVVTLKDHGSSLRAHSQVLSSLQQRLGDNALVDVRPFMTEKNLLTLRLSRDGILPNVLKTLSENDEVVRAEPNWIYRATESGIPNDPDFGKTWGLRNTGQTDAAGQTGKAGADINVIPLWQSGFVGSRNVLVAVVDTGVQWDHPDLAANIYTNPGEAGDLSKNGVDDDGNGFVDDLHGWNFFSKTRNSSDDQGHGTHCAGTIGGVGNNGVGVAGVNWEVSILPVKFLGSDGSGTLAGAVEAVNYARIMKAQVLSASWGGGASSETLTSAIKSAQEAGILFVAAAGNDGKNNDTTASFPANTPLDNVIAVAATDNQDKLATFSNYGATKVHVAAPGVKVYSTTKGSSYATLSGTSMATPHVSGIAALLLSVHPEWNYGEIKKRLIVTSDPVRALAQKVVAKGRVNAYNALTGTVPPSTEPPETAWVDVPMAVESAHPYAPNTNQLFPITVPGAKFIRVHFEKVSLEYLYDTIRLETKDGKVLGTVSSLDQGQMTDYFEGDTVVIRLKTDGSEEKYGFKVDKVQVVR